MVRTRCGCVRFTDFHEENAAPPELVARIRLQSAKFQRPDLLVGPPGPAVPHVLIERTQVSGMEHGEVLGHTERHTLVRGIMQGKRGRTRAGHRGFEHAD